MLYYCIFCSFDLDSQTWSVITPSEESKVSCPEKNVLTDIKVNEKTSEN